MYYDEWIINDEFMESGLTLEQIAFINVVRGLSDPSGLFNRTLWLEKLFPASKQLKEKIKEVLIQNKTMNKVRILPNGKWWFPERCSEKLGKKFIPEKKDHWKNFVALLKE